MAKNLVIVESPAKAKTIEGYLGKDYHVLSSFGHIRDLPKKGMAVDIEHDFTPTYEVTPDKKEVISKLRKEADKAELVYLASDDDREGEAISWHLAEALKLPKKKTRRIVFQEITKNAILKAIEFPRDIDQNLVNAQQARRVLDRLVGFELSPILWKKIKTGLSAGRVQSVAVRLVVDREREIEKFAVHSEFKVVAEFRVGKKVLKAELPKKWKTEEEAQQFLQDCANASFSISALEAKDVKKSPYAPFTTSTLQQEASRLLGYSVSQTMRVAQKLYEGGHITYMRTDSVNLSEEALQKAKKAIDDAFGSTYATTRRYKTKSSNAQEAHEAIRPTHFERKEAGSTPQEKKLYGLIWRRAIASQMSDALLERTHAHVAISTRSELLTSEGEVVKFDGFLKVYEPEGDDAKKMLPPLSVGQDLPLVMMQAKESFSKAPARYTEATLVKKLEELGIGRPSTYAPTISTILNRGYIVKETREGKKRDVIVYQLQEGGVEKQVIAETFGSEKNKLFPTNIAMVVNDFLVEHFPDIVDFGFTKDVEEEFDAIAEGKKIWNAMIAEFYKGFHDKVVVTEGIDRRTVPTSRDLGIDPKTKKPVLVRLGRFGPLVQRGTKENNDVEFASLNSDQFIETITLEEALALFATPKAAGVLDGEDIHVGKGRFGPYLKWKGKFYSIPKEVDLPNLTQEQASEIIRAKDEFDKNKHIASHTLANGDVAELLNGRFGPYIKVGKKNVKIPKTVEDPKKLTTEEVEQLVAAAPEKKFRRKQG